MPGDGGYTVTFSYPNCEPVIQNVFVANNLNSKVDCRPPYTGPTVLGADLVSVAGINTFTSSGVLGADQYEYRSAQVVSTNVLDGAETMANWMVASTSGGYAYVQGDRRASGSYAYHLAHTQHTLQTLTIDRVFRLAASSKLEVKTLMGWATTGQVAKIQISLNLGSTWQDIWTQTGTTNTTNGAETKWTSRSFPLGSLAGQEAKFRFAYDLTRGVYYDQADPGIGFYFDDIKLSNVDEVVNFVTKQVACDQSFAFTPTSSSKYLLSARPRVSGRYLPFGPGKTVSLAASVPVTACVRLDSIQTSAESGITICAKVTSGSCNKLVVVSATSLSGPWVLEATAKVQHLASGGFEVKLAVVGDRGFYRVQAQ